MEATVKPDISVVVLTFNEKLHIERCIKNAILYAAEVFVVDCFSTDNTVEIAEKNGANVTQREWPGNQALQFNWALENLPIKSNWVLRLDADEYLLPELIEEIKIKLHNIPNDVTGIVFKRRHIFLGKWMRRGTYPVKLLRLFRYKKAICEQRWMDEHIQLLEGKSIEFENDFVDHNLNNLTWWISKHNNYVIREAIDLLDIELNLTGNNTESQTLGTQAAKKRQKKIRYSKQPLFWRSFAYFCYRYILKMGFLEGKEGFLWHFFQGWWYRTLVDAKIWEIKRKCINDKEHIKKHFQDEYKLKI